MRSALRLLPHILRELHAVRYCEQTPLTNLRMVTVRQPVSSFSASKPPPSHVAWQTMAVGQSWGGKNQEAWFAARADLPRDWGALREHAPHGMTSRYMPVLRFVTGRDQETFGWPEGLLYLNGSLRQGINRYHEDIVLRPEDLADERLEMTARMWSGMTESQHRIDAAEVALLDRDLEALYYLMELGCQLAEALSPTEPLADALADILRSAYRILDLRALAQIPSSSVHPMSELRLSVSQALERLRADLAILRTEYDAPRRPSITLVGHGHLDVAWLWQMQHTRAKTARTFSVANTLMDWDLDYVFLHTTPQVFAWLKQDEPALYTQVVKRIHEGRFEAAGVTWVEPDTNIPSGESLVRQILYGERFMREEFGAAYSAYPVLWLPDCFGYSGALPQIMLRSGLKTLVTTKLSWNDTNHLPHDTFRWRGIDGSERLVHFLTTPWVPRDPNFDFDTYNGKVDIPSILQTWSRYQDKAFNQDLLLAFGNGDGGAGPTRQHLEQIRALHLLPGLPKLSLGRADEFAQQLYKRVWPEADLPTWDGELYLEFHRGVYTTHGWLKRLHRQLEARLLLAEALDAWQYALAPTRDPDGRPFLDEAWRVVLLHEFHDILPGSAIGPVYEEARQALRQVWEGLERAITRDLQAVLNDSSPVPNREAVPPALVVFNPAPFAQGDVLTVPTAMLGTAGLPSQPLQQESETVLIEVPPVPARSFKWFPPADNVEHACELPDTQATSVMDGHVLENGFFRVLINHHGELVSCIDKRTMPPRELIRAGQVGNQLCVFEDRPREFDAWNLEREYRLKPYFFDAGEALLVETGPLRLTLHVRRAFQGSHIEQRIRLYRNVPRIDFVTTLDWHNHHLLLKALFPLDLRITAARAEIQYGSLERPIHHNTSWDRARFETYAHRWVDLSEADYGVALLNDGRYGYDIHGSTLGLSLLRSPTDPDPTADQGRHELIYSLFPHQGDWRDGGVVAAGYALNHPLRLVAGPTEPLSQDHLPFFRAHPEQAVIETVKRPMTGDGLIIRIYEAYGSRCHAHITAPFPLQSVRECDLLERVLDPQEPDCSPAYTDWLASPVASHDAPRWDRTSFSCMLRPFEVRTFRLTLDG